MSPLDGADRGNRADPGDRTAAGDVATTVADPAGRADAGSDRPVVISVVGPTASGKSALGLALARALGGEVVNADAYQVYRGMDIGTAKPTPAERANITHHLIDVLDVTDDSDVAWYQREGRAVLRSLQRRNVAAVVVGGSGLYVRALLDDLRLPGSDPQIRARWEAELARLGPQALHAVLAERDPAAARDILASNGRRIVRALEVGELTGAPFVARLPVDGPTFIEHVSVGVQVDRADLDQRIAARVDHMLAAGLVEEVTGLIGRGLREGRTAARALGYPQILDVIDGTSSIGQARDQIVTATRAYARRQQRWFRRDPRTWWVPAGEDPAVLADSIVTRLARPMRRLEP